MRRLLERWEKHDMRGKKIRDHEHNICTSRNTKIVSSKAFHQGFCCDSWRERAGACLWHQKAPNFRAEERSQQPRPLLR